MRGTHTARRCPCSRRRLAPRSRPTRARAVRRRHEHDAQRPAARSVAQFLQQREPHRSADGGERARRRALAHAEAVARGRIRPRRWSASRQAAVAARLGRDGIERGRDIALGRRRLVVLAMTGRAPRSRRGARRRRCARSCGEIVAIHIDTRTDPRASSARFVARWCAARRVQLTVRHLRSHARSDRARRAREALARGSLHSV